jgi:glycosyltransferase involved in cell wall biosynthesis
MSPPFFSVIVPTYDRPGQLADCLGSLTRLAYPRDRFEVIVIDDGGGEALDAPVAVARRAIDVTLIRQPHGGPAAARNAGAARARGDVLACTSDDCAPATDWLRAVAARLASAPRDCAVGGRMLNALPDNPYSTASHLLIEYLYSYYNAASDRARFFTPNNLSLPRAPFVEMGGFDQSFADGTGEDREFCDRWLGRGHPMVYGEEIQVSHAHPLTLGTFCRQQFRYGRGSRRFHRVRASRGSGRIELEPVSFYVNLIRYPLSRPGAGDKLRLAALLGLSQIANAAGFLSSGGRQVERPAAARGGVGRR